ncbi:cell cycle checkpoint control protein RAD9B [Chanos chanos]|uniref:Cell cycle checkpoint control protein RAD9A n=1 Tax=Chanos chanos TaxID=29144 RepID=A0A6J2UMF7_CHACN|nr:cell cycle checkpoint control protein RAD9B-like [Chanos chanos]
MRCIIEGNGVKVFGKALHALSRIGEDIWLDPMKRGFAVRSVNTAHSAYACFLFSPLFFQHYSLELQTDCGAVKCRLALKSVLPLFRCLATIERSVDRCEISFNVSENRVMFQFYCRHGITKTHNLGYQECEALQAVFPTHLCPNVLKAQAKLLGGIVMHFPVSQQEITLSISPQRANFKNYCDEECDHVNSVHTEISLHPNEFDYYQVGVDSDITFCLKELRGLLSFADSHALPVSVHFGASGKPVSFSVEDMLLEASVVLATLVDPDLTEPCQADPTARHCTMRSGGEGHLAAPSQNEGRLEANVANAAPQQSGVSTHERVPSSQSSPVFSPAFHMRRLMELREAGRPRDEPRVTQDLGQALPTPITPATYKIRSLLFGAVSCEQRGDCDVELPSLVCGSDTEDDGGEGEGVKMQH